MGIVKNLKSNPLSSFFRLGSVVYIYIYAGIKSKGSLVTSELIIVQPTATWLLFSFGIYSISEFLYVCVCGYSVRLGTLSFSLYVHPIAILELLLSGDIDFTVFAFQ